MKRIILPIKKLFAPKITEPLTWSVEDFERAKKWAKARPHPDNKNKTIWDVVYTNWKDSVNVLHEINQFIKEENDNGK